MIKKNKNQGGVSQLESKLLPKDRPTAGGSKPTGQSLILT